MMMLFYLNFMMSLIFLMLKHPLSMGMILLIQTLLISLITGNFCYNFWFSYILFLIMIGGMLILFIYMTSIASNEKFLMNYKIILMMFLLLIPIFNLKQNYYININNMNNDMINMNINLLMNMSMTKYLMYPSNLILIFMIMYLFLTLIAIVKISNINKGPLRQMN